MENVKNFMSGIGTVMKDEGLVVMRKPDDPPMGLDEVVKYSRNFRNGTLIPGNVGDPKDNSLHGNYVVTPLPTVTGGPEYEVLYGFEPVSRAYPDRTFSPDTPSVGVIQYQSKDGHEIYATTIFDSQTGVFIDVKLSEIEGKKIPALKSIEQMGFEDGIRELFSQIRQSVFGTQEETKD